MRGFREATPRREWRRRRRQLLRRGKTSSCTSPPSARLRLRHALAVVESVWAKWRKGGVSLKSCSHPSTLRLGTCSRRFPAPAGGSRGAASGLAGSQNLGSGSPLRAGSVATEKPGGFATPPTFETSHVCVSRIQPPRIRILSTYLDATRENRASGPLWLREPLPLVLQLFIAPTPSRVGPSSGAGLRRGGANFPSGPAIPEESAQGSRAQRS